MEEYRSCHCVEGELFFNHLNKISYCCMLTKNGGQPNLYNNYCGELIDWNEFFSNRDSHIELMKNGGSLEACEGCLWIENLKWPERKNEIRYILINTWVKCNLKCIYCSTHCDEKVINETKEYDLIPVIKDMIEKKVITENTEIDIAGGESTLDPRFNDLLNVFINNGIKNINVNTNSTVFSKSILQGISQGSVSIITSIDCSDSKKFELIKKQDLYNTVWKNLKRYSNAINKSFNNKVQAKYILLPGINDTKREIKKFIIQSKNAGITDIILNIDLNWLRENNEDKKTMVHIIELSEYFIKVSQLLKINFHIWAHIDDLIKRYNILSKDKQYNLTLFHEPPAIKNKIVNYIKLLLLTI